MQQAISAAQASNALRAKSCTPPTLGNVGQASVPCESKPSALSVSCPPFQHAAALYPYQLLKSVFCLIRHEAADECACPGEDCEFGDEALKNYPYHASSCFFELSSESHVSKRPHSSASPNCKLQRWTTVTLGGHTKIRLPVNIGWSRQAYPFGPIRDCELSP